MSAKEIDEIIDELDYAKNHKINYTEFIAASINVSSFLTEEKLDSLFNTFDVDGSGKITEQNIKDAFSKFGRVVSEEEVKEILN